MDPLTSLPPASTLNASPHSAGAAIMRNLLGKKQPPTPAQIDKLALDFESQFLSSMLEPMFSTTQWFGGGASEDIFRSLMVREFGTLLAKTKGMGIADMVKKELLSLQEATQAPDGTQTVKG